MIEKSSPPSTISTCLDEGIKGSIELGKLADIAILSEGLTSMPLEDIGYVRADLTIMDGKVQWRRCDQINTQVAVSIRKQ